MDIDDIILNYDPANAHRRFRTGGLPAEREGGALPHTLPCAGGAVPKPAPLETAPKPTDDLTRFAGDDAVIVNCGLVRVSAQRTTAANVIASCAVVHSH